MAGNDNGGRWIVRRGFRKNAIGCGDHVWIKDRRPDVLVERASVVYEDECLLVFDKI